ncbi:excalibur calcium-binding domain-containing protein [Nocardia acidivorans]
MSRLWTGLPRIRQSGLGLFAWKPQPGYRAALDRDDEGIACE